MTTRITHLTLSRGVLDDVALASRRLAATQRKLSSGKELTRPSDDPPAVARALQLRNEMEAARQFQRNVSEAQGWQDVTESALAGITDAVHRVRELVIRAGSDTTGPEARQAVAQELRGLIDTIKQNANAAYGGRYVFAGVATDVKPYELGTSDAFAGVGGTINRQIGPGVAVTVNANGPTVIGDETGGLLATLRTIVAHVEGNTPADGVALRNADLVDLDERLDEINAVRATVGATTNRLEAAAGRLAEYEGSTLELLSETEDVDVAKAMVDFSVQQAALQASLKAGASIVQNSLLDFLR